MRHGQLLLLGLMLGCGPRTDSKPSRVGQLGSEAIVQRQVDAYNAHDLENFLATYSDSVALQTLPDTAAMVGKDRLRESSKEWFTRAPAVHADIVHRKVLGSFVVDQERITGTPDGAPLEAVAIYQVSDGSIRRVWFVPPGQ